MTTVQGVICFWTKQTPYLLIHAQFTRIVIFCRSAYPILPPSDKHYVQYLTLLLLGYEWNSNIPWLIIWYINLCLCGQNLHSSEPYFKLSIQVGFFSRTVRMCMISPILSGEICVLLRLPWSHYKGSIPESLVSWPNIVDCRPDVWPMFAQLTLSPGIVKHRHHQPSLWSHTNPKLYFFNTKQTLLQLCKIQLDFISSNIIVFSQAILSQGYIFLPKSLT